MKKVLIFLFIFALCFETSARSSIGFHRHRHRRYTPRHYTIGYVSETGPGEPIIKYSYNNSPAVAYNPNGTWVLTKDGWGFTFNGTTYASNVWLYIDNKWYFIDATMRMVTGFNVIGGKTYYFNTKGEMVTGYININNYTHYFDETGAMVF